MKREKCSIVADLYLFNMICFQYTAQVCAWDNGGGCAIKRTWIPQDDFYEISAFLVYVQISLCYSDVN